MIDEICLDKSKFFLSDADNNFTINQNNYYNRIVHKQLASIMFNCDQYYRPVVRGGGGQGGRDPPPPQFGA